MAVNSKTETGLKALKNHGQGIGLPQLMLLLPADFL